jgi:dipeptidyl aminopeptidase/acylaminoacyl peptidase
MTNGDPYTADSVWLKKISLYNYNKINKPLLVFQGANDVRVLPIERWNCGRSKENGVLVHVVYPDEGHGFQKGKPNCHNKKTTLPSWTNT